MISPWDEPSRRLKESAAYRALAGGSRVAERLPLAAAAWVTALLARDAGRKALVVVPGEADALAWLEAHRVFSDRGEARGGAAVYFSAPSLSPYQDTETSLHVRAQETIALDALLAGAASTVVLTPRALFRRLPLPAALEARVVTIEPGAELPVEALAERLVTIGFERRDLVTEVGEFAVRGGVFDLFPPGRERPVRLDLFGDTVESLRAFSPEDQRSREEVARLRVLPLSLYDSSPGAAARMAEMLAALGGETPGMEAAERIEALGRKGSYPGWEHFLPALEDSTTSIAELAGDALRVAVDRDALAREVATHEERLASDFAMRVEGGFRPPPPEALEHGVERVAGDLEMFDLEVADLVGGGDRDRVDFGGTLTDLFHGQLPRFPRELETARARGEQVVVVCPAEHRGRIERLCETYDLPVGTGGLEVVDGELSRGFRLPAAGLVVYGEPQIFPRVGPAGRRRRAPHAAFVSGLRDLRVGEYVVHADHGIGQFIGLRTLADESAPAAPLPASLGRSGEAPSAVEVMEIAYANDRVLLVPLDRLDLIQRFGGAEGDAPRVDRLGGTSWARTKERVKAGMRKLAADLLKLYAERQVAQAPAIAAYGDLQAQFAAAFDFEETPDQLQAIGEIQQDLGRERPMDRLLCGDVGFGKTEVAMRAVFQAVEAGFQVAVLAPTTILADQHYETFGRRFADFPVSIDMISRFRSPSEVRALRKRLAAGEIDVLIGTHRLLSQDIELPRLGLLVVDEEQRFGVAQKERLTILKRDVHVLAMSATPVPRTLQLSLAGVRDLSVIQTPPRDRLAVETVIVPFTAQLVREAIEDELERDGQVFYVYNRVDGIERVASFLRELMPDLRLTIGHGRLPERELASRMHAFKNREFDVLLATTIIENGIDISNVNTMIVHRADRFGLAQLYQLRGRVGRGNQLAYCYLTIAPDRVLSETARKRLKAIREFTELGAGFRVAARDLEIRGAGNLLGAEQSGHIASVGIETYLKMLEETVRELRGEEVHEAVSTSIDLPLAAHIPTDYLEDANLRMEIYRRIAAGEVGGRELVAELRDRFGPPPPPVLALVEMASLKRLAESLRVQSISSRKGDLQLRLRRDTPIDVDRLIEMVAEHPGASFSPTGVLTLSGVAAGEMVAVAREALERLAA